MRLFRYIGKPCEFNRCTTVRAVLHSQRRDFCDMDMSESRPSVVQSAIPCYVLFALY